MLVNVNFSNFMEEFILNLLVLKFIPKCIFKKTGSMVYGENRINHIYIGSSNGDAIYEKMFHKKIKINSNICKWFKVISMKGFSDILNLNSVLV